MGLLGVDPRSIKVLPRLPHDGLFQWSPVLLRCSHPCSLSSLFRSDGGLFRFTYFLLLYSSALTVLRPRVGSIFTSTDICPISPISELLGMVDKATEYGSVRCSLIWKGSKDNFPQDILDLLTNLFPYLFFTPLLNGALGLPRTRLSSAASPGHFCLIFLSSGHHPFRLGPLNSPGASGPSP